MIVKLKFRQQKTLTKQGSIKIRFKTNYLIASFNALPDTNAGTLDAVSYTHLDVYKRQSLYQGIPYLPALNWMSQIRMDEYLTKVVQILLKFVLSFSPKPCLSRLALTHQRRCV